MIKNHGLIIDRVKQEDYVLGAYTKILSGKPLQEDGNWLAFLPIVEAQERNNVETFSCVSFGTLNAVEMLIKRMWNMEENYSDRYLAIASGTTPLGNSPQTVIETLRKISGAINEDLLPFDKDILTFDQYHSPKPLPESLSKKGKKWLKEYELKHEWVWQSGENKQEKLKEALKFSPIGVSVLAWQQDENGTYVKPKDAIDGHWVVCVGYEENKHWIIFDSYPASDGAFLKKLSWNYDFQMAKRYFLKKNKEVGLWQRIINYLSEIFK